jgi:cell division protein FtsW
MVRPSRGDRYADLIAMVVVVLMAIGTVFVFSASANIRQELDLQKFYRYPELRQILFFPLACLVMYVAAAFDYRRFSLDRGWLRSPATWMLAIGILLLVVVSSQRFYPWLPQLVPKRNQHYRWLQIAVGFARISFQPSELAKWAIVFFLAGVCHKLGPELKLFWKRFVPVCFVVAVAVGLIIIEDFGTAAFVSLLSFFMLIIGGARLRYVLAPVPLGILAFVYALVRSPARMQRITAFLHPEKWTDGINFQPNQSLIALGSGGLWGKGLGQGICKYGHLPEDTTDFIFAIIGEELGFVGNAAVILLFIVFIWLGILIIRRCSDFFAQLLAGGIILTVAIQAALNIGVVTVVLPTKGIPLPFVSAGGTSMLLSSAAVGVLLNIARQTATEPVREALETRSDLLIAQGA